MPWNDRDNDDFGQAFGRDSTEDVLWRTAKTESSWRTDKENNQKNQTQAKKKIVHRIIILFVLMSMIQFGVVMYFVIVSGQAGETNLKDNINHDSETPAKQFMENQNEKKKKTYSAVIQKRLEEKHTDMAIAENKMVYTQIVSDKPQNEALLNIDGEAPYYYDVQLKSIRWTFPTSEDDPIERSYIEEDLKQYAGAWFNHIIYTFLSEKYQKQIKTPLVCIHVVNDNGLKLRGINQTIDNDISFTRELSDYVMERFSKRTSPFQASDVPFESQWCYNVYNYKRDELVEMKSVPKSDHYPNVKIRNMTWHHKSKIDDITLFDNLLEQKMELVRQDMGACLADYPDTSFQANMTFLIPPTGGPFVLDETEYSYKKYHEESDIEKCLRLGKVLPSLFNDAPMRTDDVEELRVIFDVKPQPRAQYREVRPKTSNAGIRTRQRPMHDQASANNDVLTNHNGNISDAEENGGIFVYDCTHSFISRDKGYGDPSSDGACPTGTAKMEMVDHKASIYDAIEDCKNRGMRLPTYHELSAAGQYAKQLGLKSGNYWANNKDKDVYVKNCNMPLGNCGRFSSPPSKNVKQWYRCVEP